MHFSLRLNLKLKINNSIHQMNLFTFQFMTCIVPSKLNQKCPINCNFALYTKQYSVPLNLIHFVLGL